MTTTKLIAWAILIGVVLVLLELYVLQTLGIVLGLAVIGSLASFSLIRKFG
mgnify:CR=1 FL=1